jgi:hypothetical protein
MSLSKRSRTTAVSKGRRAAPSCRNGVSSVLRLAQPAAPRLPSKIDIESWVSRAANALRLPQVPQFAPSDFAG